MTRTKWIAVMLGVTALGCGGKGEDTTPTNIPALTGDVRCYEGDSSIKLGGKSMSAEVYVRRSWDAASNTMSEEQVSIVGGDESRTWQAITVNGSELTIEGKYKGGTWSGTGSASGAGPWWPAWSTKVKLDVGTAFTSDSTMVGDMMTVDSVVFGLDGKAQMKVKTKFGPMTPESCSSQFNTFDSL